MIALLTLKDLKQLDLFWPIQLILVEDKGAPMTADNAQILPIL